MTAIEAFVTRHPVRTYFALAFAISWAGFVLVVGPGGFPGAGSQFDALLPFVASAMLAGPAVAGLLLTGLVSGKAGLRELLSRLLRWRVGARWFNQPRLAALAMPRRSRRSISTSAASSGDAISQASKSARSERERSPAT